MSLDDQATAPLPKRISLEDAGDSVVIRRRWFTWAILFFVFFCAFWDGITLVFVVEAVRKIVAGDTGGWAMLLFISGHMAIGAGLTYYTLATLFNTTTIRISATELTIRHGPVPWFGQRTLDPAQVKQLFVERKVHRGKNGSVSYSYRLHAILLDDQRVKLLSGITDENQARFLEHTMERFLAIQDSPVKGEHRPL